MWCSKWTGAVKMLSGCAINLVQLVAFRFGEWREERVSGTGEQRLAAARRSNHEDIVMASNCETECSFFELMTEHIVKTNGGFGFRFCCKNNLVRGHELALPLEMENKLDECVGTVDCNAGGASYFA